MFKTKKALQLLKDARHNEDHFIFKEYSYGGKNEQSCLEFRYWDERFNFNIKGYSNIINKEMNMETYQPNPNIYHTDSIWELNFAKFIQYNQDNNRNILCKSYSDLNFSTDEFRDILDNIDNHKFLLQSHNEYLVTNKNNDFIMVGSYDSGVDKIETLKLIYVENINLDINLISTLLETNNIHLNIKWFSIGIGGLNYTNIKSEVTEEFKNSLYPFIDYNKIFIDFENSKSNILILIGEPGTGKSTFIRNLLKNSKYHPDVFLTYDNKVLENDNFFVQFISNPNPTYMVIEDADSFIGPKENGNSIVSKFLNSGDGLIKLDKKKIIISTNIVNVNHIDSALMRPGRCFDIIKFRALTGQESNIVSDDYNLNKTFDLDRNYTISQIFNDRTNNKKSFGFM